MLLLSTSQLQVTYGSGSATWTTVGDPIGADLTQISVSDDDATMHRADLFFGNETGTLPTIDTSDDPSLIGREVYLGDTDNVNEDGDGFTTDEYFYPISGFDAHIAKIVIYDGTGPTNDPASYDQYYAVWGPEADAALNSLMIDGTLSTGQGAGSGGLNYGSFADERPPDPNAATDDFTIVGYATTELISITGQPGQTDNRLQLDPTFDAQDDGYTFEFSSTQTNPAINTVTINDENGTEVVSGQPTFGIQVVAAAPDGGTINLYSVVVNGATRGYVADDEFQPGVTYSFTFSSLNASGDDAATIIAGLNSASYDHDANNTIEGGTYGDALWGDDGDDSINASGGDDTVDAGAGNDTIVGGEGADSISGGEGNDVVTGDGAVLTNLITNGDFSSGDSDWTINNPTGGNPPLFGSGQARFNSGNETSYGDSIEQDFTANVGVPHTVSLELIENYTGVGDHTFQIEVLDDVGAVLATETRTVQDGPDVEIVRFSFVPTTATNTLRITNTTSTNSIGTDGRVDNISVFESPTDTIDGGGGDDTITGGVGDDSITTGSGEDTVILADGSGSDTVTDFSLADSDGDDFTDDQLDVSNLQDEE